MSFDPLDPNRYAAGTEAQSIKAMAEIERADVELARKRQALAEETYRSAEQRFTEAEAAYKQVKAARDDASLYLERASCQLDTSIERLAKTNALLHPVRKTPPEVLGMIFEACLDYLPETATISEQSNNVRKRQLQPFYLAAVCRRWRHTSLACPQAWSSFDLQLDGVSKNNVRSWKAFLSCFVERSLTRPLDIRIIRKLPDNGSAGRLVPLLVGALERSQSLLLSAADIGEVEDVFRHVLTAATPALRRLHFLIPREVGLDSVPDIFPDAPNVRTVRTSYPVLFEHATFPDMDVVVLCNSHITATEDDLAVLADLGPKHLSLVNSHFDDVMSEEKAQFPVQTLRISQYSAHGHLDALPGVYAFPKLYMLCLWGNAKTSEARVALLARMAPVTPFLRTVHIDNVAPSDLAQLLAALRSVSRLGVLHLKAPLLDTSGLTELCDAIARPLVNPDGKTAWFCPLLEHLLLAGSSFAPDCAQEKLVELMERRLRAPADTQAVLCPRALRTVTFPVGTDAEIKAQVSGLLSAK
ncbi:hypothetical protein AURDEDRAFT_124773 [Auricularia subglabra TFB-10046 SS5]|nr:hypothetical protein AURDEDRAFT_124773 [Auricularia subglabra TFB-10046 SS5]